MHAAHYAELRALHVTCAALSGTLFTLRGLLRIKRAPLANHRALRAASYAIDTTLLLAAVLLTLIVQQYPFVNGWLTAKVLLLALYIGLGMLTLKWAQTTLGSAVALLGALLAGRRFPIARSQREAVKGHSPVSRRAPTNLPRPCESR